VEQIEEDLASIDGNSEYKSLCV